MMADLVKCILKNWFEIVLRRLVFGKNGKAENQIWKECDRERITTQ
jgi:hypothetical protein